MLPYQRNALALALAVPVLAVGGLWLASHRSAARFEAELRSVDRLAELAVFVRDPALSDSDQLERTREAVDRLAVQFDEPRAQVIDEALWAQAQVQKRGTVAPSHSLLFGISRSAASKHGGTLRDELQRYVDARATLTHESAMAALFGS